MADGDSLNDLMSDEERDGSAGDAGDVEDDEVLPASGVDTSSRKKNKKKKRAKGAPSTRPDPEAQRSSGESDNQTAGAVDEQPPPSLRSHNALLLSSPSLGGDSAGAAASGDQAGEAGLVGGVGGAVGGKEGGDSAFPAQQEVKLQQLQKAMELMTFKATRSTPRNMEDAKRKQYQFWDTQPVPKLDEEIQSHGPIEPDKPVEELRREPYSLPGGFEWDSLDIDNPLVLKEIYTLLNENYVEDDDNMFRFDYSPEFLHWALKPPGWLREWHIGVRVIKSGKLIGFISGVPAHIRVYDSVQHMVEINFLCVHKKLRSKRVAPVLIREVTRRVNCRGMFQAVYTAGVVLPKPVSSCRYWHRSLNPRKLIDVKFSHLSRNMTMQRTLKLYKLPETTKVPGFRPMTINDIPECHMLVTEYLKRFDLAPMFSREDFCHWFIPRPDIVSSYVVETNKRVTDFVSFYTLPSTVMHHATHKSLKAAYGFYNVSAHTPWVDLMQDALIAAKTMGFDVFNALDLMDNKEFLEKLKFGVGDGNLQYYLYNWKCPTMSPHKVGLVLQ